MNNNEELLEIAAQLRALAARVEALTALQTQPQEPVGPQAQPQPEVQPEPAPPEAPVAYEVPAEPEAEVMATKSEPATTPVATPGLTFSLNDRYRFRRELFGGSGEVMDLALEAIGPMKSAAEVEHYLIDNDYDMDADIVKDFLQATTRRFESRPPLLA